MTIEQLAATAQAMVAPSKGILAVDETPATCTKRFAELDIQSTEETRHAYRQMLCTAPAIGEYIGGVILVDETIRQRTDEGAAFAESLAQAGLVPGIKVDRGAKPLANAPEVWGGDAANAPAARAALLHRARGQPRLLRVYSETAEHSAR